MKPFNPARRTFYHGWAILGALSLTETVSWGIVYYGFSVFLPSIEKEFQWTRAETTGAFSLALLISGLAAIPVGRFLDRHGSRGLMTAGSIAATVLLALLSQINSLPAFYAIWAALGLTMAAILYDPAFTVLAQWFARHRSRAMTILTLFAGLASTIFNPLNNWIIQQQGWRMALLTLSLVLGVLTIAPHAFILRRRPADLGLRPDGDGVPPPAAPGKPTAAHAPSVTASEALQSATFWSLAVALVLTTLASITLSVHLIPYLLEKGYPSDFAALSVGLIGFMQIPGRLFFAPLMRFLPRRAVMVTIALMQGGAVVLLALTSDLTGVLLFVAFFGMANGMSTLVRASSLAEYFGPANYGTISGWVGLFTTLARAAGPLGAGLMYTAFHGYLPVFWTLAGAALISAVAFYMADAWWRLRT
ncbi:MAG: MFS transporter [Chloroflexi bacterium]|nr:MFS transporter [Chloroflexota bacterium]